MYGWCLSEVGDDMISAGRVAAGWCHAVPLQLAVPSAPAVVRTTNLLTCPPPFRPRDVCVCVCLVVSQPPPAPGHLRPR